MSKGLVTQMEENRKQNISIKIGDHKRMSMNIDPAEEELIRQAEHYVNYVLDGMKRMFAGESVSEQTARTAFQFAKLYLEQQQANLLEEAQLEYRLRQRHLEQCAENLRVSRKSYDVGLEPLSDLLTAQVLWQQAYADKAEAAYQLKSCLMKWRKAAGRL